MRHSVFHRQLGDLSADKKLQDTFREKAFSDYAASYASGSLNGALAFNSSERHGKTLLAIGVEDASSMHVIDFGNRNSSGHKKAKLRWSIPDYHACFINRLAWNSDDSEVYSTSEDSTVKVFDVTSGVGKESLTAGTVIGVRPFSGDGRQLLVCSENSCLVWDRRLPAAGARTRQAYVGHSGRVVDCTATSDGALLLTASFDGTVKLWDTRLSTRPIHTIIENRDKKAVTSVTLDRTETSVLVNSETANIHLVNLLALNVAASSPSTTHIHDLPYATQLRHDDYFNRDYLRAASFSPDGHFVLAGSDNGQTLVWSVASRRKVTRFWVDPMPAAPSRPVRQACFGPTHDYPMVAVSTDEVLHIWQHRPVAVEVTEEVEGGPGEDDDAAAEGAEEEDDEDDEAWAEDELQLRFGECSYGRGYCSQTLHICLTCRADTNLSAGLCAQCAALCHSGHHVVNIGRKHNFRCDCPSTRLPSTRRCLLRGGEQCSANENRYDHTFENRYCFCDGEEARPMVQCATCCDWFHFACIGLLPDQEPDDELDFACETCLRERHPFLAEYAVQGALDAPSNLQPAPISPARLPSGTQPPSSPPPTSACALGFSVARGRFLPRNWRDHLLPHHRTMADAPPLLPIPAASNTTPPRLAPQPPTSASAEARNVGTPPSNAHLDSPKAPAGSTSLPLSVPSTSSNDQHPHRTVASTSAYTAVPHSELSPSSRQRTIEPAGHANGASVAEPPPALVRSVSNEEYADGIRRAVAARDVGGALTLMLRRVLEDVCATTDRNRRRTISEPDVVHAMDAIYRNTPSNLAPTDTRTNQLPRPSSP